MTKGRNWQDREDWQRWAIPLLVALAVMVIICAVCAGCNDADNERDCDNRTSDCREEDDDDDYDAYHNWRTHDRIAKPKSKVKPASKKVAGIAGKR